MVHIDDLSFRYEEKGEELFSSFSLEIEEGERILLISPPGSGKTTLARILTGSAPKYTGGMISGRVYINGTDVLSLDIAERMGFLSRVSQNSDEMILFSALKEELSFPLENLGLSEAEINAKTEWALKTFELEKYREVSTAELSGGEKKRLMIAILFMLDPYLYILDESFDELSPYWRKRVSELLIERGRSALILGSHFLPTYDGIYSRVITIENGRAASYERKEAKAVLDEHPNSNRLEASGIFLERGHRSVMESHPFSLDISSLSLNGGSCTLLLGENGSGKSTLSKVLCGLLKEQRGSVLFNGRSISEKERRRTVSYLMQNPFEQLFLPTVKEELESTGADRSEIGKALELFGLEEDWYISEIPYGRAKLVQAAIFYLLKRPFAIFDELDSALSYEDSIKAVKVYLESGTGLMIITHDEYFASLIPGEKHEIRGGIICR